MLLCDLGRAARLPKSGDLNSYDRTALDAIVDRISNRPGTSPGWRTPAEAFAAGHSNDG